MVIYAYVLQITVGPHDTYTIYAASDNWNKQKDKKHETHTSSVSQKVSNHCHQELQTFILCKRRCHHQSNHPRNQGMMQIHISTCYLCTFQMLRFGAVTDLALRNLKDNDYGDTGKIESIFNTDSVWINFFFPPFLKILLCQLSVVAT